MEPGTIFLGDLMGFGPSRLAQSHVPRDVSFTDTLNEGRVVPPETPTATAAFSHPVLAPSVELVGLAALVAFLFYMDRRIKVFS